MAQKFDNASAQLAHVTDEMTEKGRDEKKKSERAGYTFQWEDAQGNKYDLVRRTHENSNATWLAQLGPRSGIGGSPSQAITNIV